MSVKNEYLQGLVESGMQAIEMLIPGALGDGVVMMSEVQTALEDQVIVFEGCDHSGIDSSGARLIDKLNTSSDRDTAHVVRKVLKSTRQAAYTYVVKKDAVYKDESMPSGIEKL